jgi:hypothetical protein
MFLGRQSGEGGEIAAFGLDFVEEARQRRRQWCRLGGAQAFATGIAPGQHQPRKHQPPGQIGQRRRDFRVAGEVFIGEDRELLGIEIAHRQHARQQQRLARPGAQKGLGQRSRGAARRQQHGHPRQRQRIVAGARVEAGDQRVEKG